MAVKYIAQTGINWPDKDGENRAEIGEEVPAGIVSANRWLLDRGYVKAIKGGSE